MKIVLKISLIIGVIGYLVFAIITMSHDEDTSICTGTEIILEDSIGQQYVNTRYIESILAKTKIKIDGQNVKDINIPLIEGHLKASPYVDSVICYYTSTKLLCIKIIPRIPILHVMADNGECFYMDINGNDMPTDQFPLDICLATGNITKKFAKEQLLNLAVFLGANPHWGKDIQQIYVNQDNHIELIPTTGNHKIIIGDSERLEEKMNTLHAFYKQGLDKIGWNKYSIIDLSYSNQVVCTKRKNK